MSNENLKLFFDKMNESQEMAKKVVAVETPEEVQAIAKSYGVEVTLEDIMTAKDIIYKQANGELSEADLEGVAGGALIDVDIDIFDSKNESDLNNQISLDLGICASLIGSMSTGNFAAGQSNLEMITAQLYTWIYEWQNELNHVINKNIIKDEKNEVEIYYFPTSFVNRKSFFDMMRSLYTEAGGSLTFLIASTGVDPDSYYGVLDEEIADGLFDKYKPHLTSWTATEKDAKDDGRPEDNDSTNENTIRSKANNSNNMPKPSSK